MTEPFDLAAFDAAWDEKEARGEVDSRGGTEYRNEVFDAIERHYLDGVTVADIKTMVRLENIDLMVREGWRFTVGQTADGSAVEARAERTAMSGQTFFTSRNENASSALEDLVKQEALSHEPR